MNDDPFIKFLDDMCPGDDAHDGAGDEHRPLLDRCRLCRSIYEKHLEVSATERLRSIVKRDRGPNYTLMVEGRFIPIDQATEDQLLNELSGRLEFVQKANEYLRDKFTFHNIGARCASCSNEARYISERGTFVCGICPIAERIDSIKLADVPALLKWCREVLTGGAMGGSSFEALRSIVGRKP